MPDEFTFCKRCGRRIIVKTPGQEYGPKCARILAGQLGLTPVQLEEIEKLPEIS